MIKIDGVDIPRIEYIDPVDGKVSILRVMQDGVQIWPSDLPPVIPNIPTGLVLSEYEVESELQIPTGITLREVMNIPTGITLREVADYTYLLDDYPGAVAAYSLQKLSSSAVQGIMVRRDPGDQLVDVRLYDDPSKSIDLDSITESGGQTLGEWVGSASGFIFNWYDQSGSGNHASQLTEASQPMIINAGVLIGGVEFNQTFMNITPFRLLSTFSIYNVASSNDLSNTMQQLSQNPGGTATDRFIAYGTRITSNMQSAIQIGTLALYEPTLDTSNHLYIYRKVTSSMYTRVDGVSNTPASCTAGNVYDTDLRLGGGSAQSGQSGIANQNISEMIIYPSDESSNDIGIEANINSRYNIWVVTAEVDAQLIQADNDNVSDAVIEINGVRSSVSDTAVANLISRNVTVITA